MRRMMSFVSGAVMGALVGATLALLFAPASGQTLRSHLQERINRLQDEVRKAARDRRAELEEQLAALRSPNRPMEA